MNTNQNVISTFNNLGEGRRMDFLANEFSGGIVTNFKELVEGYVQNVDLMLMFYQFCKNKIEPTTLFFDPKADFTQKEKVDSREELKEICNNYKYSYDKLAYIELMDEEAFNFFMSMLDRHKQSDLDELVRQYSMNEYKSLCSFLNGRETSAATIIDFINYIKRVTCEVDASPTLSEGKFNIPKELLAEFKAYNYDSYCYFIKILNKYSTRFINRMVDQFSDSLHTSLNGYIDDPVLSVDIYDLHEFASYISDYIQNSDGECVDYEDDEENE